MLQFWTVLLTFHGEKVSNTGAWILPKTFKYHIDRNLSSAIVEFMGNHKLESVIDIGAGKGAYAFALKAAGYEVDAVDGARNIAQLSEGLVRTHDLTTPFRPCTKFDMVLSLEVAEHIPKYYEESYLNNIKCSCRKFLIVSWAPPGQAGSGHVNLARFKEVKDKFERRGFKYRPNESKALRAKATLSWFRRNLAVFAID